jgi:signal transduction histidine kinase
MRLSLKLKLVLFLIVFSAPALLFVEMAVLTFEYRELVEKLNAGAVQQQADRLALELVPYLEDPPEEIRLRIDNTRLALQDPFSNWLGEPFALAELSAAPIKITLRRADGSLWVASLARTPAGVVSQRWVGEAQIPGATELVRIEVLLSAPWQRVQSVFSYEWPIMVASLILVGVVSGFFLQRVVLRRLDRIANAAEGWSKEKFSAMLKDDSQDEIGVLSRRLNDVAQALKSRMDERARLAGLEERERLAQDLHDSVKQHGFALELQLGALAHSLPKAKIDFPEAARQALEEAQSLSSQIRRDLDVILNQLRAEADGASLGELLAHRAQDFSRRSGIPCELFAQSHSSALQDSDLAGVMRIVDESLSNVWRHSGATAVRISLSAKVDVFLLRIADNGSGFDASTAIHQGGMGLRNLSERARRLPGGHLRIDSLQPNKSHRSGDTTDKSHRSGDTADKSHRSGDTADKSHRSGDTKNMPRPASGTAITSSPPSSANTLHDVLSDDTFQAHTVISLQWREVSQ